MAAVGMAAIPHGAHQVSRHRADCEDGLTCGRPRSYGARQGLKARAGQPTLARPSCYNWVKMDGQMDGGVAFLIG